MNQSFQKDEVDLSTAETVDQLAAQLRRIHIRAGKVPYRQIEMWADEQRKVGRSDVWLTRSAISEVLTGKRLPSRAFLINFLTACDVSPTDLQSWISAWERIADHHHARDSERGRAAETDAGSQMVQRATPLEDGRETHSQPSAPPRTAVSDNPWGRGLAGRTQSFLCWLSDADVRVLRHCPQEARKFTGLGGVVLTTAIMAVISATVTVNLGFAASLSIAIPVGIAWGLAVMNLDRWMVSVTQRRERWTANVGQALPRLILAVIIGAIISTPLVLWLFQREVNAQLAFMHENRIVSFHTDLFNDPQFRQIPDLQRRVDDLQKSLASIIRA
jgi:hypothetical protein